MRATMLGVLTILTVTGVAPAARAVNDYAAQMKQLESEYASAGEDERQRQRDLERARERRRELAKSMDRLRDCYKIEGCFKLPKPHETLQEQARQRQIDDEMRFGEERRQQRILEERKAEQSKSNN